MSNEVKKIIGKGKDCNVKMPQVVRLVAVRATFAVGLLRHMAIGLATLIKFIFKTSSYL